MEVHLLAGLELRAQGAAMQKGAAYIACTAEAQGMSATESILVLQLVRGAASARA